MEDKHIKRLYTLGGISFLLALLALFLVLVILSNSTRVTDGQSSDVNSEQLNRDGASDSLQSEEPETNVQNVESVDEEGNPIIIRVEQELEAVSE